MLGGHLDWVKPLVRSGILCIDWVDLKCKGKSRHSLEHINKRPEYFITHVFTAVHYCVYSRTDLCIWDASIIDDEYAFHICKAVLTQLPGCACTKVNNGPSELPVLCFAGDGQPALYM